jgi:tRNA pseudouridine-54 N-methylase
VGGGEAETAPLTREPTVILGDADDPNDEEQAVLRASGIPRLSLGPRSMRASQCLDVWQNLLDRRGVPGHPRPLA